MAGTNSADMLERMVTVINHGWLALVLSLGERTGLHTALRDEAEPAADIAARAGCDERYAEIWLWAMVAGGFVEAVPVEAKSVERGEGSGAGDPLPAYRFALCPGAGDVLTPRGGPLHWSRITEQITAFAALEDELVAAFAGGGGLPASRYEGRVTQVLAAESTPIFERTVLAEVFPHFALDRLAAAGAAVADLGCGTGDLACLLAARFPRSTFTGVDQSPDAISGAREKARKRGLANVRFEIADLEDGLGLPAQDLIIAANVVHDMADPAGFFARVRDHLRPGGTFYLHELSSSTDMAANVGNPHAIGILAFSLYHCLPLAKRRPGLAPGGMFGTRRYVTALEAAGFADVAVFRAPSDPTNDTVIARLKAES
jgi:SAM-dependent methyltransferase